MATAPKITSCDVIFDEVVPHTSKNKVDKTITVLSTLY